MIKDWYNRLSNSARAALATAFFTFLGTVGIQLLGLLQDLSEWVDGGVQPTWDIYVKVIVSAFIAAVSGLVNYAVRAFQARSNPSAVPQYSKV